MKTLDLKQSCIALAAGFGCFIGDLLYNSMPLLLAGWLMVIIGGVSLSLIADRSLRAFVKRKKEEKRGVQNGVFAK
jgi:hypothetical protein